MKFWHIITLVGIHLILGKKASFPYGAAVGINTLDISLIVIITDFLEIPFYNMVFTGATDKIKLLKWLHNKLDYRKSKLSEKKIYWWFRRAGEFGVFLITVIPGAGGVQTGTLLAHSLHMKKSKSYPILAVGSVVGCIIFALGFKGLLKLIRLK